MSFGNAMGSSAETQRRVWRWLPTLAVLILASAGLVSLMRLSNGRLERASDLSGIGSLVFGAIALAVGYATLRVTILQTPTGSTAMDTDEIDVLDRASDKLAEVLGADRKQDASFQRVTRYQPLRVRWSTTDRPVSARPDIVLAGSAVAGRATRLRLHGERRAMLDAFRQLPARQMVILGEEGSGKTVFAMTFTIDLINNRAPGEPVPVFLPLSSWNPHTDLHTWMARRLTEVYPALASSDSFGVDVATRLLRNRMVIPVLDGLDELPEALHDVAIEALSRSVAHGGALVLTCRTKVYESAVLSSGTFLSRAAVVELERVDVDAIVEFLDAAQIAGTSRWNDVIDRLRTDPNGPLAGTLSTPLMADLARIAYAAPATRPAELCNEDRFPSHTLIEEHLLAAYLPTVYGTTDRYRVDQAQRWLGFLAHHLDRQQTRDLAWWDIHNALPTWRKRVIGGLVLGSIDGLVCGAAVSIGLGWGGFAAGFAGALTAGLYSVMVAGAPSQPRRLGYRSHSSGRLSNSRRRPAIDLLSAGGVGIVVAMTAVSMLDSASGVIVGLVVSATVWVVAVIPRLNSPTDPTEEIDSSTPASLLRDDKVVSVMHLFGLVFGAGLMAGLALGAVSNVTIHVAEGLFIGAVGGLMSGIVFGLLSRYLPQPGGLVTSAWAWFVLSRGWLSLIHNHLPWRSMTFLEHAHHLGVFRRHGTMYQFRHSRVQDHLVEGNPSKLRELAPTRRVIDPKVLYHPFFRSTWRDET